MQTFFHISGYIVDVTSGYIKKLAAKSFKNIASNKFEGEERQQRLCAAVKEKPLPASLAE